MQMIEEDDKPWKVDLARKSALRREAVAKDLEEAVKKAATFEDALKAVPELMKRRFARYTGITIYVADGEDLAVFHGVDRPRGPERVWSGGGPLAEAANGHATTNVGDVSGSEAWSSVGLTKGSVMVSPVRTEAGLWAILEIWSEFRDAFTTQDVKTLDRVAQALGKRTPTA